jgi:hypothetical protein
MQKTIAKLFRIAIDSLVLDHDEGRLTQRRNNPAARGCHGQFTAHSGECRAANLGPAVTWRVEDHLGDLFRALWMNQDLHPIGTLELERHLLLALDCLHSRGLQ